jgi:hypothetical protein
MSFATQKHASGMIGVLVVGLIGWFIFRAVLAGGFENMMIPGAALENEVVEQLEAYPGNDVLLERLEADFPRAYDDFTEAMGRAARGQGGENRVLVAANVWMGNFFASHDRDFAAAPIANLDRVIDLEQDFLESLRDHDEYACAAYAKGEAQDRKLPESFDAAGGEIVAARFSAIAAGRNDQQLRLGLTPTDYEALEATMRGNGLNDEQIAVVYGAADPASIGAPLACEMAIELVSAIRAQPEERRALLIGSYASGVE